MADAKISALTNLTAADAINDMIPIVDVSDTPPASGNTKRISINNILSSSPTASGALTVTGLVTAGSATITGAATVGTTLGVTGVSTFAAGTALLPALTTTGDTNTGIYYPAADTFAVSTGGTERLRVNSVGQVGIAITPTNAYSSSRALQIGQGGLIEGRTGDYTTFSLATNAYLSSAGDWTYSSNARANLYAQSNGAFTWASVAAGTGVATFTPAMTLDASGNLLVGTTTNTDVFKTNIQFSGTGTNGLIVKNLASTGGPALLYLHDSAQTLNNTGASAYYEDSTALRWKFFKNGGLSNYQANDTNLSDIRVKTDIKPLTSYWNKIKALELVTFKYKDQTHSDDNIGLIAQQVESVAPELIDVDGFGETPADGVPLKTIYTTDLYHAAIKALQEAMTRIEVLESKLA